MKASRVGETVWVFNIDRRVYPKPEDGRIWASGGPIYREHFVECVIVAETPMSWKLNDGTLISKKTGASKKDARGYARRIYTAQEVEDDVFVNDRRPALIKLVSMCRDADTLRAIEALLTKQ